MDFIRRSIWLSLTLLLSLCMVWSCTRNHTSIQHVATNLIIKHSGYPQLEVLKVRFGSGVIIPASDHTMKLLADEGLIKYEPLETMETVCNMFLTEKGEKYVVGDYDGEGFIHLILAEKQFLGVTRIIDFEDNKKATVEYTWQYGNLTPFGKYWKVKSGEMERNMIDNERHAEKIEMVFNEGEWCIKRVYEQ